MGQNALQLTFSDCIKFSNVMSTFFKSYEEARDLRHSVFEVIPDSFSEERTPSERRNTSRNWFRELDVFSLRKTGSVERW